MESSRFRVSQSAEQEYHEATSNHRRLVVRFSQRRRWNRSRHDSPFRECRYGLMFLLAPGLSGYAFEGAGAETKLGFKAHSQILRHVCGFGLNYVLTATPNV